jgi:hypothetical protein
VALQYPPIRALEDTAVISLSNQLLPERVEETRTASYPKEPDDDQPE